MVDPLDEILLRRAVPEAPSNLAYRIIEASKHVDVQQKADSWSWLTDVLDSFLLPKPALAMAVVVLLGIYIGFSFQEAYMAEDEDLFALYLDDGAELGDWL